ncbi:MAG: ABC transporter substrate-binding protein [Gordonia amarae]
MLTVGEDQPTALDGRSPAPGSLINELTRREFTVAGGFVVLGAALTACSSSEPAGNSGGTRTVSSAKGPVEIPADPQRIVVINAGLAGSVYALGAKVAATGVSVLGLPVDKSGFPSVWSAQAQSQGSKALSGPTLDVEEVAVVKPDLIIGGGQGFPGAQSTKAYDKLRSIAPTVLVGTEVVTWQDQLKALATIVGADDRVPGLVKRYQERVAAVRTATTPPAQPSAFLYPAINKIYAVPSTAALPSLFADAGFTPDDVHAKMPDAELFGSGDSFEVSDEKLGDVLNAPSLFVVNLNGVRGQDLKARPGFSRLPAVQNNQVYDLPAYSLRPDYYAVFRTLDTIEKLFRR